MKFITLLLTLLFTTACNNTAKRDLDKADKIMVANPDSALCLLEQIDTDNLSKYQQARHAVLKAKAQTKVYIPVDDEPALRSAVDWLHNDGDSLEVQALYYHGRSLLDIGNEAEAMARFTMAYDIASLNRDYFYAAMAARSLHDIYSSQYVMKEGLKWAKEEKGNFDKAGYDRHAQWAEADVIESLIQNKSVPETAEALESVSKELMDNDKDYRVLMLAYKARNLYDQGRYTEALEVYRCQEEEGVQLNAGQLCNVAECRMALGDMTGARSASENAMEKSITPLDSVRIFRIEAEILAKEGDYEKAFKSAMKFAYGIMADGDAKIEQPYLVVLAETMRAYYILERQLNAVLHRNTLLLTSLVCALLAAALFLLLWRIVVRRLRKKEFEVLGLQAEVTESEVCNMDKSIHTLLGEPLGILNSLCERIYSEAIKPSDKETRAAMKHELSHIRSEQTFSDMEEMINQRDNDWMKRFDSIYPDLSKSNRRLAMLLYLGFSSSAIALLTDRQSQAAVYTAKSRLKKQLTLDGSSESKEILDRLRL